MAALRQAIYLPQYFLGALSDLGAWDTGGRELCGLVGLGILDSPVDELLPVEAVGRGEPLPPLAPALAPGLFALTFFAPGTGKFSAG